MFLSLKYMDAARLDAQRSQMCHTLEVWHIYLTC